VYLFDFFVVPHRSFGGAAEFGDRPGHYGDKTDQSKASVSSADIAAAKTAHKVWVNLDTGIYHKGGRWYGKTKNGKFMTVDDAKKAGYKAAKRD
jgi:hypothetical protein